MFKYLYQDEKKTASKVDSLPKMQDLICLIIYNVFLTSSTFAYGPNVFYHGHNPMLVFFFLNQSNCWVGANYLCLVLLDYLGGFLYSKALIGQALKKFILEKESSVPFRLLLILLGGILSPSQLIKPALVLAINMNFPLSYSRSIRETSTNSAKE